MNIVDDISSFSWTILLKLKSDAFTQLQSWEYTREVEIGSKVEIYRTDNGELKSQDMANWLASRGTTHQYTALIPQPHIGHMERLHCTLMAKARTMHIYAGLPAYLWDEFYLTATHLYVKTTTKSLQNKTPWELWYGQMPDYSYMCEIGCRAFILIQNQNNPKIYEWSIECILIGYNGQSKTYRCYYPKRGKSTIHITFDSWKVTMAIHIPL
jgi:hypothetical protein